MFARILPGGLYQYREEFMYQQRILSIKAQIEQTDKEIDALVYELYGLTDEEIRIVEGS